MDISDLSSYLRNKNSKKYALLGVAAGIILLSMGGLFNNKETEKTETSVKTENISFDLTDNTSKKMEAFLQNIEGAGKVRVMITYKSSAEKIVAEDKSEKTQIDKNNDETSEQIQTETKKILLDKGSHEEELILKEISPEIEGVVIIAEGGDDIYVKNSLSKAAQALTDVAPHKIEVLKMGG